MIRATYLVITTLDTIMLVSLEKRTKYEIRESINPKTKLYAKYEIRESINIQGQLLLADLSLDH